MKKILNGLLVIGTLILFSGCSKDDDSVDSRTVEYKVTVVKADITRIVYTGADGTNIGLGSQPGLTWSSGELQIPESVTPLKISAEAEDLVGVSSLKVEIFVNGVLKADNIDTDDVNYIFEAQTSF